VRGHWLTSTFVTNYIALVLFPILYFGARFYYKGTPKKPHEMDFVTNIAEIEAETYVTQINDILDLTHIPFRYDEPPPRNKAEAFWQWLVSTTGPFFFNPLLIVTLAQM
jgi:yeast amino acid transporter